MEKIITNVLIGTTLILLIVIALLFNGYRLHGSLTYTVLGIAFMLSEIVFIIFIKSTRKKIIAVFLGLPLFLVSLLMVVFVREIAEYEITDQHSIIISPGGILGCGEMIHITKNRLGILRKEIYHESTLCLTGIDHIETVQFTSDKAEFLIHHDGKRTNGNPYRYTIQNNEVIREIGKYRKQKKHSLD